MIAVEVDKLNQKRRSNASRAGQLLGEPTRRTPGSMKSHLHQEKRRPARRYLDYSLAQEVTSPFLSFGSERRGANLSNRVTLRVRSRGRVTELRDLARGFAAVSNGRWSSTLNRTSTTRVGRRPQ